MDIQSYLSRYAELIAAHGANVQPGQRVTVAGEVCHRELCWRIADAAYRRGAAFVHIDLVEPRLQRSRVLHSAEEQLHYVPRYVPTKFQEVVDDVGAVIRIVGAETPELMADLDPRRMNALRLADFRAREHFYEEGIKKSRVHWTVAAGATVGWGEQVFPDLRGHAAETALWREIFRICRVDQPDVLGTWEQHNRALHERAKRLTELGIRALHFRGPGTDLTVGLSERAVFRGGSDTSPRGVSFEPNIPTEECFTTPDARQTEGHVRTTRPFFVNGRLIKGLKLEFRAGRIVSASAREGLETFEEYCRSDDGAVRLGEVALVGIDSPVFRSGHVFHEILFDENAACHIAIGSAYKFCLRDGDRLSDEELNAIGCNQSSVHTDMMISSEEVDVDASLASGERRPLLVRGEFVDELR